MIIETAGCIRSTERSAAMALWNREYPQVLRYAAPDDFDTYLEKLQDVRHYFLKDADDTLYGWAFTFTRDSATWFGILLDQAVQGKGHGRRLMDRMKRESAQLNGWVTVSPDAVKADGSLYRSPLGFYRKNGFLELPDITLQIGDLLLLKVTWNRV